MSSGIFSFLTLSMVSNDFLLFIDHRHRHRVRLDRLFVFRKLPADDFPSEGVYLGNIKVGSDFYDLGSVGRFYRLKFRGNFLWGTWFFGKIPCGGRRCGPIYFCGLFFLGGFCKNAE